MQASPDFSHDGNPIPPQPIARLDKGTVTHEDLLTSPTGTQVQITFTYGDVRRIWYLGAREGVFPEEIGDDEVYGTYNAIVMHNGHLRVQLGKDALDLGITDHSLGPLAHRFKIDRYAPQA